MYIPRKTFPPFFFSFKGSLSWLVGRQFELVRLFYTLSFGKGHSVDLDWEDI